MTLRKNNGFYSIGIAVSCKIRTGKKSIVCNKIPVMNGDEDDGDGGIVVYESFPQLRCPRNRKNLPRLLNRQQN